MKKTGADSSAKGHTKARKTAVKPAAIPRGMTRSDDGGEPFSVFVSDLDQYLYDQGVHYEIFRKLGAHPSMKDGRKGIHFAVWAPNAAAVHLIGEFNGWNEEQLTDAGSTRQIPLQIRRRSARERHPL